MTKPDEVGRSRTNVAISSQKYFWLRPEKILRYGRDRWGG